MSVVVIGRIFPNPLQGDVVLYNSMDSSGTWSDAFSIGVFVKNDRSFNGVGILHVMEVRDLQ